MRKDCYFCIDLKSFYASVECVERGLDPLRARLVVADNERGPATVCLAVTPPLKKLGIKSRCRIYQIPDSIQYIKAVPRMKLYMKYSARIYKIYLKYFDKDDIHVYSIDEAFIDAGRYLKMYGGDAEKLALRITGEILKTTGITAACGIGTNLYLAKAALDLIAKKEASGIAALNEQRYRALLWDHKPLTDFWRIGKGMAQRLEKYGIYTMKQLALADRKLIYKTFGVDAELMIDHAWGRETVTMSDIKSYIPKEKSISAGQVLSRDYSAEEARLILKEIIGNLCLELVEKDILASAVSLDLSCPGSFSPGRAAARGSVKLPFHTDSYRIISEKAVNLYDSITDRMTQEAGAACRIRRINVAFSGITRGENAQLDMFSGGADYGKEREMAKTVIKIKDKFGKNSIFSGMSLQECATAIQRNGQIGGHKA